MSLAGCQNNPINLNFYLQKSLEIFEKKKSADKICSLKEIKVKMPFLVPDRVNLNKFWATWVFPFPKKHASQGLTVLLNRTEWHFDFQEQLYFNIIFSDVQPPWKQAFELQGGIWFSITAKRNLKCRYGTCIASWNQAKSLIFEAHSTPA